MSPSFPARPSFFVSTECLGQPAPPAAAPRKQAISRFELSARACHRLLKVARTIADISGGNAIEATYVAEAVQYRRFAKE